MSTEDKGLFLHIDGVGKLMENYCRMLEKESKNSHTVLFYGDTGCGKCFLSNRCIEKVKEKRKQVIVIDLWGHFRSSTYESERKLVEVLKIIEYELLSLGAFNDLAGLGEKPEIFRRELKKILKDKKSTLLIRFPLIEVFDEIAKYYAFLCNEYTILYFITEKMAIVDQCRAKLEEEIQYYECMHLKEGDGKLVIEKMFFKEGHPTFKVEDIESLMAKRPISKRMTIKELKKICTYAYAYAEENKILYITKDVIADALASKAMI